MQCCIKDKLLRSLWWIVSINNFNTKSTFMKNSLLLRSAVILTLFVVILASCSKEKMPAPAKQTTSGRFVSSFGPESNTDVDQVGSIRVNLLPLEFKMSMVVFSSTYNSGELFPDADGIVRLDNLVAGDYTVTVHAYNTDYADKVFDPVTVNAGKITDIGKVTFGQ